jgi:periplasmic protein TonB
MMTEKQDKLLGICASLGLHGLMAAVLIFSLSGNALIPRDLGKLEFVWVSIAAKDKTSFLPAAQDRRQKRQSTEALTGSKPDIATAQNFRGVSETTAQMFETTAHDKTTASAGSKAVAPAATGDHPSVSEAGRSVAASGAAPAFSNAYPLYRENPPPGYPEMARQRGYEGVVRVQAEILADGRVGKAVISQSSGYAILDQTAINAVKAWKFIPAKKSGIPYKTWAELPIKFVISDNNSQS